VEVLPFKVDVLVSAGLRWGRRSGRLLKPSLPRNVGLLLVDSGAQQFNTQFRTGYPYPTELYYNWASSIRADYVVSLDVPCDLVVPRGDMTVKEALELTLRNAVRMDETYQRLKERGWRRLPTPLPTIQGHKRVGEFLSSLESFKGAGLVERYDYFGIGSLCIERSPQFVYDVCRAVRRELGWKKRIHVFGPSVPAIKRIWGLVDSLDSALWAARQARGTGLRCAIRYFHRGQFWEFFPRFGAERRYPSKVLKEIGALEWLKFLRWLEERDRQQTRIDDHIKGEEGS